MYVKIRVKSGCSLTICALRWCCNEGMNNNTHDNHYRQPADSGDSAPDQYGMADRFFLWVRRSALMRGNDRWIAGVCDGIAVRYNFSPILVRAVIAALTVFFGFGAIFYAAGWALLPDCRDNKIVGEELVHGHWQWSQLGPIVLCVIAAMVFYPFSACIVFSIIAVAVLLVMVNILGNKALIDSGDVVAGDGQHQKQTAQADNRYRDESSPYTAFAGESEPAADVQPTSVSTTQGSSAFNVPPTYMAQAQPSVPAQHLAYQRVPKRVRRKPAGLVLVLLAVGFIIVSGALIAWYCLSNTLYMGDIFRYSTYWIGAVLLFLGVMIAVLGLNGRRSGGLNPLMWVTAVVAVLLVVSDFMYSEVITQANEASNAYKYVNVSGFKALDGSDDLQFRELNRGVAFHGDRLDTDGVNIDLSEYAKTHNTHDVELKDGSISQSGCPTGIINLTDAKATVFVTLPAGCSYNLSHGATQKEDVYGSEVDDPDEYVVGEDGSHDIFLGAKELGSGYVSVGRNSQVGIGGRSFEPIGLNPAVDHNKDYEWFNDPRKMPKNGPELTVCAPYIIEGRVIVQYPDESTVPDYTQFIHGKTTTTWRR